jgi:hypothetical protein
MTIFTGRSAFAAELAADVDGIHADTLLGNS